MSASTFPDPSSGSSALHSPVRRPVRTGTIVWGLLIIAVAVLLLAWLLTDITLDPLAVLLGLMLGGGGALLLGGAISVLGGRRHFTRGGNAHPHPNEKAS